MNEVYNSGWIDREAVTYVAIDPQTKRPTGHLLTKMRRQLVCLCGSTRFMEEYQEANRVETLKGRIVLSCGQFSHAEKIPISDEEKDFLDELHRDKIDLADVVLVIDVGGYIGSSTASEIAYAIQQRKPIRYWSEEQHDDGDRKPVGN